MKPLTLAVLAMLLQQAFSYMSTLVLPLAASRISDDLGLDPALLGVYTTAMYAIGIFAALSCGGFIRRYGALRISQIALLSMALGLMAGASGNPLVMLAGAGFIGLGAAVSTPASSEILARYAPPRHAPLIFSIKQTGVPVGGILAGLLVPLFIGLFGWRGGFVAAAGMCAALAVLLQPLRREFDHVRDPSAPISLSQTVNTLRAVSMARPFRELAIACLTYVGIQSCFGAFFVLFMTKGMGHDLSTAGYVFAISQAVAVFARILWGWLSGRWVTPRTMLALLGVGMAIACVATGMAAADWSILAIAAAAIALSATAISFHGVMLAEVARLAPPGQIATMTGGVLSFASAGMLIYPAIYSLILGTSDANYGYGFLAAAAPALLAGLLFLRAPELAAKTVRQDQ